MARFAKAILGHLRFAGAFEFRWRKAAGETLGREAFLDVFQFAGGKCVVDEQLLFEWHGLLNDKKIVRLLGIERLLVNAHLIHRGISHPTM